MLTAEMASTNTKPNMILPRNRKVGSFSDIVRGRARFVNFTSYPRRSKTRRSRKTAGSRSAPRKPRVEWIRGRKLRVPRLTLTLYICLHTILLTPLGRRRGWQRQYLPIPDLRQRRAPQRQTRSSALRLSFAPGRARSNSRPLDVAAHPLTAQAHDRPKPMGGKRWGARAPRAAREAPPSWRLPERR